MGHHEAPRCKPQMLTVRKRGAQAEKFPQGSMALTAKVNRPRSRTPGLSRPDSDWLTFLFWNLHSIAPFRHQVEQILSDVGRETPEREHQFDLLLG